jgi:hydrogenase/urease accessory protein HupE
MSKAGVALLLALAVDGASAHPLAPALLQIDEMGPQRYAVTWRTPVSRTRSADVAPQLPATCVEHGARESAIDGNEALVQNWTVACSADLTAQAIAVSGLAASGINVVVRIARDGSVTSALLDAQQPAFVVPARRSTVETFRDYFALGVEHLLTGLDHVLFLLGLVLLVPRLASLVVTVTAFTVGHCVTLALATLGFVHANAAITELGIAASIVAVAWALATGTRVEPRHPWALAGGFGLVHGLGFAGALAAAGLPAAEVPLSLLGFNLGIEAGQLVLVAVALATASLWRGVARATAAGWAMPRPWAAGARGVFVYAMGGIAACWCFERSFVLLG